MHRRYVLYKLLPLVILFLIGTFCLWNLMLSKPGDESQYDSYLLFKSDIPALNVAEDTGIGNERKKEVIHNNPMITARFKPLENKPVAIVRPIKKPPNSATKRNNVGAVKKQCNGNKCNFVFIKTMKCATETVVRILRKYSYDNDLNIMLPRGKRLYLAWPYLMDDSDYRLSDRPFNGLIDHAVYNKTIMNHYFPPNTTHYVTIIREPLSHFKSAFSYFKIEKLAGIFAKQPLKEYLDYIEYYDSVYKSHEASHYRYCIPDGFSVTKNFIAHCLGMPLGFPVGRPNISKKIAAVRQYINDLDKEFSLVMIVEYFHESLILFKRLMKWQLKDIIYKRVNRGTYYFTFSQEHKAKHKKWTPIDYMLYDHFNQSLWRKIAAEGPEFQDELKQFSEIQFQVNRYCWGIHRNREGSLDIQSSPFNPSFRIMRDDCESMDISWLEKIKAKFDRDNQHVRDPRPALWKRTC